MKHAIIFLISFLLLNNSTKASISEGTVEGSSDDNAISIYCSPDLYRLTTSWAHEYCRLNPGTEINVVDASKAGKARFDREKALGFISGNYPEMYDGLTWNMVVGRDIIIPVFNPSNPLSDEIYRKGISPEDLSGLLKGRKTWGDLLKNGTRTSVSLYIDGNKLEENDIPVLHNLPARSEYAVKTAGAKQMIASVGNDPNAVGLCGISDLTGSSACSDAGKIRLLPIDRNGNGNIDYMESIYSNPEDLLRGVWIGKYPKELVTNIYAVSSHNPAGSDEVAFLKWILTGGQKIEAGFGYSALLPGEQSSKLTSLTRPVTKIIGTGSNYAAAEKPLLVLFITALIILTFYFIITSLFVKENVVIYNAAETAGIFNDSYIRIPEGLFYDKSHTWAFMEQDGMVKIGIDDFLQHVTGPITGVKMKKKGEKILKGKPFLSIIRHGKQLNLYSPVSGTIREFNGELNKNTGMLNSSPYTDGWVYRIEPAKWLKEIDFLIMGNKYNDWLKSEFARLKEFIASTISIESVDFSRVMQDGGELKDGILSDLGPEIWDDFQTNFIDQAQ